MVMRTAWMDIPVITITANYASNAQKPSLLLGFCVYRLWSYLLLLW